MEGKMKTTFKLRDLRSLGHVRAVVLRHELIQPRLKDALVEIIDAHTREVKALHKIQRTLVKQK